MVVLKAYRSKHLRIEHSLANKLIMSFMMDLRILTAIFMAISNSKIKRGKTDRLAANQRLH